jgi:hypothetical protein
MKISGENEISSKIIGNGVWRGNGGNRSAAASGKKKNSIKKKRTAAKLRRENGHQLSSKYQLISYQCVENGEGSSKKTIG